MSDVPEGDPQSKFLKPLKLQLNNYRNPEAIAQFSSLEQEAAAWLEWFDNVLGGTATKEFTSPKLSHFLHPDTLLFEKRVEPIAHAIGYTVTGIYASTGAFFEFGMEFKVDDVELTYPTVTSLALRWVHDDRSLIAVTSWDTENRDSLPLFRETRDYLQVLQSEFVEIDPNIDGEPGEGID